ncbi:MAG: DUF1501 domain-containing protein [Verrucomicrobiales bacterium]|nr:DUF1501 domain-containing protein [Verrucomicrobiales bacterium]
MKRKKTTDFCGNVNRREFLNTVGGGFPALALTGMLGQEGFFNKAKAATSMNPLAEQAPRFKGKAKSVIFLFMYGGPSHIDTFDYKPQMVGMDGKTIQVKTFGRGGKKNEGRIVEPKWGFKQYGESGKYVSDLFPHVGSCVDDISFIHSMTADSPIHGSALLMMNSGSLLSGHPSLGSWVNYGLGSVNENLPGYVVMLDQSGGPISGAKNWSSGFMPASYQGTVFRSQGSPILNLDHVNGMPASEQKMLIDSLNHLNSQHLSPRFDNTNLAARIASYELAYRMQATAPEAIDLDDEPEETRSLYGIDRTETEDFGRKCLLARRLVERGTRFIQIYSGGAHNDHNWDAHGDLEKNHNLHAGATDKPIAGLLKDLKRRGMLEDTLVVWGGEFGRQPTAEYEYGTGRDHNSFGFTMWMAGGGAKGGVSVGQTDELGATAVENRYHVRNFHATILSLMGLDPNDLSFFFGGLDHKLVGVEGADPIPEIMA